MYRAFYLFIKWNTGIKTVYACQELILLFFFAVLLTKIHM